MKTLTIKSMTTLLSGLVVLSILFLAASCKQESIYEEITPAQTDSQDVSFRTPGDGVVDYTTADDILSAINYDEIVIDDELQALKFPSEDVLGTTIDLIEEANAVLEAEIISSIEGLSNDEIDQMEINYYYAYEAFESHFPGFQSVRAEKAAAEEAFFANDELNDDEDPAILYGPLPDDFGAVLNTYGEVITANGAEEGQQVHVARRDGTNYTVLNGDPATTMNYREVNFSYPNTDPSIKIMDDGGFGYGGGNSPKCETNYWKYKTEYITIDDVQHRAFFAVGVRNSSFSFNPYHGAFSYLKSRRKGFLFWGRHHTDIGITQGGIVQDSNDCTGTNLNVATQPTTFNFHWFGMDVTFPRKVSTNNMVGAVNVPQADFEWEGQNYTLRLFY
jgi:hypothetical protein